MNISKKYMITGFGIVLGLVILVSIARATQPRLAATVEDSGKTMGDKNAPIQLIIYSDFQCPACNAARMPISDLEEAYPKDIRIEFHQYPLERTHRWAFLAAVCAECAAQQGKFWQYHDILYERQRKWSESMDPAPLFSQYASELGLNMKTLANCLNNPKTIELIKKDQASGKARGVQSTPTMFLNGQMIVGARDLMNKAHGVIEETLKTKKSPAKT